MLDRAKIENYRCLKAVDVPLKPLTVLIGPNNSGKSAFLSALDQFNEMAGRSKRGHSIAVEQSDRWMNQTSSDPSVMLYSEGRPVLDLRVGPQNNWQTHGTVSEALKEISFFGSNELVPRMSSQGVAEKDLLPQIDDKVSNLPAYLDALLRIDRKRFLRIIDTLQVLVPGFEDLHIRTPDVTTRRVDLVLENGLTLDGNLASYGVKLLIFFVALANHPSPPRLILLEEPENGVHPKRLEDIVNLLQGLSIGKFAEGPTQVIVTTHSPYLLDYIDVNRAQVLVAGRNDDGSRYIKPVDEERLKNFLDEFMLGEIWINQGELGLVGEKD